MEEGADESVERRQGQHCVGVGGTRDEKVELVEFEERTHISRATEDSSFSPQT